MSTFITPTHATCHTCQLPTTQTDAQPVCLLLPTGRHHNGVELLTASATLYECDDCFTASASAEEHLYTVHSCGTTRTIGAATPEEAAVLMMRDRGWRSTRSVAVIGSGVRCEFLDCELVNDVLQFSERVDLP